MGAKLTFAPDTEDETTLILDHALEQAPSEQTWTASARDVYESVWSQRTFGHAVQAAPSAEIGLLLTAAERVTVEAWMLHLAAGTVLRVFPDETKEDSYDLVLRGETVDETYERVVSPGWPGLVRLRLPVRYL